MHGFVLVFFEEGQGVRHREETWRTRTPGEREELHTDKTPSSDSTWPTSD